MTNQNTSMTHGSIPPGRRPRRAAPQAPPSQRRTVLVLAAGSAAVCGLLAGCGAAGATAGTDQAAQGGQGESITLYSGQHEQTTNGLVTAFEKQTGIKVNVRNDDEDTLANLIAVQGSHTPGDVFFTENSPPLEFLQEKGLLSKVSPATLADTPAKYNSPDGNWVGVSARVSVIVYNPSLISQEPAPHQRDAARRPEIPGQARHRAGRDRLPADRHLGNAGPTAGPPPSAGWRRSSPTAPATISRTTRRWSAT